MNTVRILNLSDKACVFHNVLYCLQVICLKIRLWFGVRFFIRLPRNFLCNMSDAFYQVIVVIFYELESKMIMDIPDWCWCP